MMWFALFVIVLISFMTNTRINVSGKPANRKNAVGINRIFPIESDFTSARYFGAAGVALCKWDAGIPIDNNRVSEMLNDIVRISVVSRK